jgi:SAM-dependent methyltransferase
MDQRPLETQTAPRFYDELAGWWPLFSAPEDYAEEAAFFMATLQEALGATPETLLELGSGGGNNASFLKAHSRLTLVDPAPGMLEVSRALNPECGHVVGDMRTVRLGREFDAVFIHDAIGYLTTEAELRAGLESAFVHCRPGGVVLLAPDYLRETFKPSTHWGGHDGEGRALRYMSWSYDPDPADTTYIADYVYLLRQDPSDTRSVPDRHVFGLFPRDTWLRLLAEVGFTTHTLRDNYERELFVGKRGIG